MEKRSRNIIILLLILLVMAISALLSQCEYAEHLSYQVAKQDSLIENSSKRDSVIIEKTEEFTKIITKYVSDCGIMVNNKPVSTEYLVKMINNYQDELELLKDSLRRVSLQNQIINIKSSDSLNVYKQLLKRVEDKYGIIVKMRKSKAGTYIVNNISRTDSALAIFPYYRDKLKVDSAGNFVITYEVKSKISEKKK